MATSFITPVGFVDRLADNYDGANRDHSSCPGAVSAGHDAQPAIPHRAMDPSSRRSGHTRGRLSLCRRGNAAIDAKAWSPSSESNGQHEAVHSTFLRCDRGTKL